jgi:hypothetical protein
MSEHADVVREASAGGSARVAGVDGQLWSMRSGSCAAFSPLLRRSAVRGLVTMRGLFTTPCPAVANWPRMREAWDEIEDRGMGQLSDFLVAVLLGAPVGGLGAG